LISPDPRRGSCILLRHAIQRYGPGLRDLTVMKWRGLPRRKAMPHQSRCEAEGGHRLDGQQMNDTIHIKAWSLILEGVAARHCATRLP